MAIKLKELICTNSALKESAASIKTPKQKWKLDHM